MIYTLRRKSNSYFISYFKQKEDDRKYFGKVVFYFVCANATYALVQKHQHKQNFSDLFKSTSYFSLLEKSLNSCFKILLKQPNDTYDIIGIENVFKHCIVFDVDHALIVTEVSAYGEHD